MINKRVASLAEALSGVRDGSTVLVAGFGDVGIANTLIEALQDRGVRELTVVANNTGNGNWGLGRLVASGHAGSATGGFRIIRQGIYLFRFALMIRFMRPMQ